MNGVFGHVPNEKSAFGSSDGEINGECGGLFGMDLEAGCVAVENE
jgi:hypothetical protein